MTNLKKAFNIFRTSVEATDTCFSDFELFEIKDKINEILTNVIGSSEVDYFLDLPCGELRIISEDHIEELWTNSLIEQIKECYPLSDLPNFISIDWETTTDTCKYDGLGHHFSSYDGEEHSTDDFYIFRVN